MDRKKKNLRFPLPRLRVLPLFILAGALMFGVRVGSLWQHEFAPASARGTVQADPQLIPAAMAQSATDAPAPPPPVPAAGKVAANSRLPGETQAPAAPSRDAAGYSQSEIEVLQHLAERREALDKRERELDQRLAVLSAAEAQIDAKIQKLREIQSTIEGLIEKHDDQENQKIESLVKIYQAMKPKDAARIFEQMDMPILIRVIKGMKERTSAAILAEMSADRANAVTTELATQSELPPDLVGEAGVKR